MNRHPLQMNRLMLFGRRDPLTRTPADAGLRYEDVAFSAGDGVALKGWFLPAAVEGPAPAIVFVHGWMWNRAGNNAGGVPVDDRDVDLLPAARALHEAGFHVLMYDVRHHGESGSGNGFLSFGPLEARDFTGAVAYLRARPDVDGQRLGALGLSMGGSIALYGAPHTQPIKAILAIQPVKFTTFHRNFARDQFGPLGPPLLGPVAEVLYRLRRTPPPSRQDPALPARALNGTVVRYVQGTGDRWGTIDDVERFAAATPTVDGPVIRFASDGRYDGYRYVTECRAEVVDFFVRTV